MTKEQVLQGLKFDLPVIAAPMFLISNTEMVFNCCKNGIVGSIPSLNFRTTEQFGEAMNVLNERKAHASIETAHAVNLIVHKTNPRLKADLSMCINHEVPLIITSLGAVKEVIDAVHQSGGLVFHDVTSRRHAEKAIEAGVDGLILVCAGAGGHSGQLNPFAFVAEVREMFDGPIMLAGSISTGRQIAAALTMGADMAYMGTRFINTTESFAAHDYKEMIINASTADIIKTAAVSGIPANFLKQSLYSAGLTDELMAQSKKIDLGAELNSEAKAWKSIWSAGHGAANITDVVSIETLVVQLKEEYQSFSAAS